MRINKINIKLTVALTMALTFVIFAVQLVGLFITQQSNLNGQFYHSLIDHPIERMEIAAELQHEFTKIQISAFQMQLALESTEAERHYSEMLVSMDVFNDLAIHYNLAVHGDPNLSYTAQRIMLRRIEDALILVAAFRKAAVGGFPLEPIIYNMNAILLFIYNDGHAIEHQIFIDYTY